jgi:hypothetical protein
VRAVTTWDCDSGAAQPGGELFQRGAGASCAATPSTSISAYATALAFGLSADHIDIPISLRFLPVEQLPISARLSGVLDRANVRVLGDLHGRSFDEFARQRNCGIKTLRELGAALRLAQHSGAAVLSQVAASAATSCTFLIPQTARDLKFADLPCSTRAQALVRKMGMGELGDLHGRNAADLLRCSNIGIGTIVEIQRLIERASRGEFKQIPVEPSAAPVALLSLIEAGLSSLASRDRELLFDRIGVRGTGPVTLEQLGSDYRVTKERARQIAEETVSKLKKTWGPRIPHLLGVVKTRCMAMHCPLGAELLEHWISGFDARLQLGTAAHIRLIGALDRQFPCWPVARAGASDVRGSAIHSMQSLLADDAPIPVSDAYRIVVAQNDFRDLTFSAFLQMLAGSPEIAVHFDEPEAPVLRRRRPNDIGKGRRGLFSLRSVPASVRTERSLEKAVRPAA